MDMKIKKSKFFIISFLGLLMFLFFGDFILAKNITYVYKEVSKGFKNEVTINPISNGYIIKSTNTDGDMMEYKTDQDYSNLTWQYRNDKEEINITAERASGKTIYIKGVFKGKNVEKTIKIDESPWYQDSGLGLKTFVNSNEKTASFWTIYQGDINVVSKFSATKLGVETIKINDEQVKTVHVKVVTSLVFRVDHWFRKSDGVVIRTNTPGGFGRPPWVTDLYEEKEE